MTDEQLSRLILSLASARWPEVATLIILVISLAAAVAAAFYARSTYRGDHKRSQRKMAMDMCLTWSQFLAIETASVTRLIESMSPQQCDCIAKTKDVKVDKEHIHYLVNILQFHFPNIREILNLLSEESQVGQINVEGNYVLVIRHVAIRYLNMLESILLAWSTGIADKKAIEKEFAYLFDATENRSAMQNLREKMGSSAFPAIADFQHRLADLAKNAEAVERPSIV